MNKPPIRLVWLKRDLRLSDHRPLWEASQLGPTVAMYVFEPSLWNTPEMDRSHFDFIVASLAELSGRLREIGGRLAVRVGEFPEVLQRIHDEFAIAGLFSHEETGNALTYQRDRRVGKWCRERLVPWTEFPQNGVVRCLSNRDGWAKLWQQRMSQPIVPTPARMVVPEGFDWGTLPSPTELGLGATEKIELQVGGQTAAEETLGDFLQTRGVNYRSGMSSPVSAFRECSRLSPYLAWGCISIKTVHQRLVQRQQEVRQAPAGTFDRRWQQSLKSFASRLAWHCHFMQKLEDEPALEFRNFNRAYDGLREEEFNEDYFAAWQAGLTGYPMIDACMRALHQHSWINFRMRAMLLSFAANHLWLHWRQPAVYLARHFLDFEPGIHFSQCQMQSGTAGINTVRIYSPAKQVADHDPHGLFIRRYVPELQHVPNEYLPEPQRMPLDMQRRVGCVLGSDYPGPIVDHRTAYRAAQQRIFAVRQSQAAIAESQRVYQKHGSRKKRDPLPKKRQPSTKSSKAVRDQNQLWLFDTEDEQHGSAENG